LTYWGSNKDRYQIEVPMANSNKVPRDWSTKSQKKTHRRYRTPVVENLLARLTEAESNLAAAQKDTLRRVFEKFDDSFATWSTAVSCVALLDALLSLATVSSFPGYVQPEVCPAAGGNCELHIEGGRHPMLEYALQQRGDGECIPNDLQLGGCEHHSNTNDLQPQQRTRAFVPRMLLLSGPNMGGKSTLLRQTCLLTVMAQIGCWVPADVCRLTPVDRIFTRVGASDRILAGQSTFFVELAETATILSAATKNSLCILDELGRGTATFDGTAIAHAVVEHMVGVKQCRALFATHYHSLITDWEMDPRVKLGHMDCLVHNDGDDAGEDGAENVEKNAVEEVTFLYKLADGSSPRSYGINVARLAGLPPAVIELALQQSREFELRMQQQQQQNSTSKVAMNESSNAAVSAASVSGSGQHLSHLSGDQVRIIFERLVSIAESCQRVSVNAAHSSSSSPSTSLPPSSSSSDASTDVEELAYVASEFWRRVTSL